MTEDQNLDQDVELHDEVEDEVVEEAMDPKNAEQQSVAAVSKAADAVKKKAPKRKGDKDGKDEPGAQGTVAKAPQQEDYDFSEDLSAPVESEATLSDEFKEKTQIIFEAAVKSKISEEIDRLEAEYASSLQEEVNATKAELVEKVDSYLNYVVEKWMEDNQVAIQTGLRTEIAEEFMNKLKDVFTESYIDVPESKVDLVDELAEQVSELEEKLNETTADAIEMATLLEGYQRESIIREQSRDLAETQVEKLKDLVENIDFEDEETFTRKVTVVKESYFTKTQKSSATLEESFDEDEEATVETSDVMSKYVEAIRRSAEK